MIKILRADSRTGMVSYRGDPPPLWLAAEALDADWDARLVTAWQCRARRVGWQDALRGVSSDDAALLHRLWKRSQGA